MEAEHKCWLEQHTVDWSGRGIDAERDLAEAREEYPDLTLGPVTRPIAPTVSGWMNSQPIGFQIRAGATLTPVINGRGAWKRVASAVPVSVIITPEAYSYNPAYASRWLCAIETEGGGIPPHPHVHTDGGICLGAGHHAFTRACVEGRWADAVTIAVRVASTYNEYAWFNALKIWIERAAT